MNALDIAFIVGYFVIILAAGFYSSRKEGLEGFLIGNRALGTFNTTMSIIASKVGGGTILVYVAYVFVFGPSAFAFYVGALLGYFAFYFFAKKLKALADKHKFYTLMDYLEYRFGDSRILAAGYLIPNVLAYAIQIIGGGKIIETISGISFAWAVIIMLVITTTYLLVGGFRSVVFTDVFQGGIFIVLLLAATALFFGEAGALTLPTTEMLSIPLLAAFLILGMVYPFSSLDLWQRVYASKSMTTLKRSMIFTLIMYFFMGVVLTLIAILLKNLIPGASADTIIVEGFLTYLPPGLLGLGVVAFFSVIMSSADTQMFSCASVLLKDIIRTKKRKHWAYAFIGIAVLGVVAALFFKTITDIAIVYSFVFGVVGMFVLYSLLFNFQKKYIKGMYVFMTLFTITPILVIGLEPVLFLLALIYVPASYWLSKLYSKVLAYFPG